MTHHPERSRPAPESRALARATGRVRAPRDEGGYALVAVFVLSAMLLTVCIIGVRSATVEVKIAAHELDSQEALAVAEAGLAHAKNLIEADDADLDDELSSGGTGGALTSLGSVVTVAGKSYRFRPFGGSRSTDGYYVRAVDNYDGDPDADTDNEVKIVSRGQIGNAERIVEAVAQGVASAGGPGFFAKDSVRFSGTLTTDSYNSALGPYGGTNVGSNGDLYTNGPATISNASTINGDLSAASLSGTPAVTGDTEIPADPLAYDIPPACGPPYVTACSNAGCAAVGIGTAAGGATCKVTVGSDGKIAMTGGNCYFAPGNYCFYQMAMSGGSTTLAVDGPTKLLFTGKAAVSGGGLVNTTHLPSNLQIISSFVTTGGSDGLVLTGGTDVYFQAYVPGATVTLTGGSPGTHFYGSVVSRVLKGSGEPHLHYDESLGGNGGIAITLSQWREVRNW